jgi:hypothetical protein
LEDLNTTRWKNYFPKNTGTSKLRLFNSPISWCRCLSGSQHPGHLLETCLNILGSKWMTTTIRKSLTLNSKRSHLKGSSKRKQMLLTFASWFRPTMSWTKVTMKTT